MPISLQGCPIPIILNFHDVVLSYFFIHCAEHVVLSEHVLHTMNGLAPSVLSAVQVLGWPRHSFEFFS